MIKSVAVIKHECTASILRGGWYLIFAYTSTTHPYNDRRVFLWLSDDLPCARALAFDSSSDIFSFYRPPRARERPLLRMNNAYSPVERSGDGLKKMPRMGAMNFKILSPL